jgi:molybdate/tungstate transport system substrate-binding protein
VQVTLGFQRFRSVGSERIGQPIVYAITVPENAPHPDEARMFLDFLLDAFQKERAGWPAPMDAGPGAAMAYHATD